MTEYHKVEIAHPELKELADAVEDVPGDRYARTKVKSDLEGQARYLEKYREITAPDPIQQGWDQNAPEFHAKTRIFSVLADAFETELGKEEGRAAVARARRKQGEEMGKLMAEKVRAKGKPLSLGNFFEEFWGYFQWSPKIDSERYYDEHGNVVKYVLRLNCPIGDYLRDNSPDVEYSGNYCDLDEFIVQAYNPNVRYSRRHWVPGGDLYSELIWELDTEDIIE
ncbi:MAG: L-2-amino-thiazoline-4-carboxylic acid hydrolase [Acidimicrobiia bacterium]